MVDERGKKDHGTAACVLQMTDAGLSHIYVGQKASFHRVLFKGSVSPNQLIQKKVINHLESAWAGLFAELKINILDHVNQRMKAIADG